LEYKWKKSMILKGIKSGVSASFSETEKIYLQQASTKQLLFDLNGSLVSF
jgi:hypothetical protein